MISFEVMGTPIPQGSKTAGYASKKKRAFVRDANGKKLKPWRRAVTLAALAAHGEPMLNTPIAVSVDFFFVPPQRPRWPVPAVKPDVDKLVRAILDGVTDAGLIDDDARVVLLQAGKFYAPEPSAFVTIERWSDPL